MGNSNTKSLSPSPFQASSASSDPFVGGGGGGGDPRNVADAGDEVTRYGRSKTVTGPVVTAAEGKRRRKKRIAQIRIAIQERNYHELVDLLEKKRKKKKKISPSMAIGVRQHKNQQRQQEQQHARQTLQYQQVCCYYYDPDMLWLMLESGSTFMHMALRTMLLEQYNFNQIDETTPRDRDWWRWILQVACISSGARHGFLRLPDVSGDTCFDMFFHSWLYPNIDDLELIPGLANFRNSLRVVQGDPNLLRALRDWIDKERRFSFRGAKDREARQGHPGDGSGDRGFDVVSGNPHAEIVSKFLRALEMISRAAAYGSVDDCTMSREDFALVSFLVRTGSCPVCVARLVVLVYPEQIRGAASGGNLMSSSFPKLPLHDWASTPDNGTLRQDGILNALVDAYPEALAIPDASGRLPLHLALAAGKPVWQIEKIWKNNLDALNRVDPVSGFFSFALAACAFADSLHDIFLMEDEASEAGEEDINGHRNWFEVAGGRQCRYCKRSKQAGRHLCFEEMMEQNRCLTLDLERQSCIFEILRACPSALQLQREGQGGPTTT